MRLLHAVIAISLVAAVSACASAQDKNPKPEQKANSTSNDKKALVAKGETVSELDKAILVRFSSQEQ
jgi:hypothetical protein